jgi:predicted PurR-regulated permease PerM
LVIILGIVAGVTLAGVLGILLAAPTIASSRIIGRYIYANLFDLDPFPEVPEPSLPGAGSRWWRKLAPR